MALLFTNSYLEDTVAVFRSHKALAERGIAQVSKEQLFEVVDGEMNSVAVIVKHMAGNMRSRWTEFLATDGEKPDRNRDNEFLDPPTSKAALLDLWEEGWETLFGALAPLAEADLRRTVLIRGEAHSVMQAVNRQVAHYSFHCGQIVLLTKHFASKHRQALTVPRGESAEWNRRVRAKEASQR